MWRLKMYFTNHSTSPISIWFQIGPSQQLQQDSLHALNWVNYQQTKKHLLQTFFKSKWNQDNKTSIDTQHLWSPSDFLNKIFKKNVIKTFYMLICFDNWFVLMNIINKFHIIKWWSLIWFLYHTFLYIYHWYDGYMFADGGASHGSF